MSIITKYSIIIKGEGIKTDILINVIAFSVVVYIATKIFAPLFGEYFQSFFTGSSRKKNSDINFDHLIEQKKAYLRGDVRVDPMNSTHSAQKGNSPYAQALHKEFNQLSSLKKKSDAQKQRADELKTILQIMDSFQWGESKVLTKVAKELSSKINYRVEDPEVVKAFKELMKREILIGKNQNILGLKQTVLRLEVYLYLRLLFYSSEFQDNRSKAWSISRANLKKALFLYAKKLKSEERSDDLATALKKTQITLPSESDTFIIKALITREGLSMSVITKELKDTVEFFKILEPLPHLKSKKDKEGALKILGLPKGSSEAQIKKQYKTLAKLKHPDRLRGKGIPQEFDKIATENFTQIQMAYDILMG